MAPSFDCVVSSLLCAEGNDSILDDNDNYGVETEVFEATWHHRSDRSPSSQSRIFDGGDAGLLLQREESVTLMIEKERQHLPNVGYLNRFRCGELDLGAREEAVHWIEKVHAYFGFGPLCLYLSINYLDRFLSEYELPKGKAWMMQLLAVACLSLAAKMEETEVPLSLDLQVGESKFVFEAKTIQRMELLVLSTLHWRMQAVTPFSFIDYFLNKINVEETPFTATTSLILHSIQLILSTIRGIDFLEFRPSEIAAAVAIAVVVENRTVDAEAEQPLSLLPQQVEKERVLKCIKLIGDMSLINGTASAKGTNSSSFLSVPHSPIGVLDAACLSYKSDDTTVGSCANSSQNTPDTKRRKLNRPFQV
ncbi:hypothetical protein K2173_008068 [Erythroxylum novogranatense]|uniref:B-like cyclin n=1 Tax=Erythroxylum novogranatense TaxID=1862640 RepID=A0AAV8T981_9ROSI|nr:hypothetical protein K2173_008068 [Erythroxylum novogranatense]